MKPLPILCAMALACAGALPVHAATIVNIKAFSDSVSIGSGVSDPDTAVGGSELFTYAQALDLAAGDYLISDAWGRPGALYDAWNFESSVGGSWTSHFSVGAYQSGPASAATYTLLIDGTITPGPGHYGGYGTEQEASAVFLGTAPYLLHLATATTVGFAAPDYYLPDNQGGISLAVQAVPEPADVVLLLAGLALLAGFAGRRARGGCSALRPCRPASGWPRGRVPLQCDRHAVPASACPRER